jgi:hypothetical protein
MTQPLAQDETPGDRKIGQQGVGKKIERNVRGLI